MKDILFIVPLYYTSNFIERFKQYLGESKTKYSYDVYLCCSNPEIFEESRKKAHEYGYIFQERPNYGGGEGALWFLQKKSGIDISKYRYVWYFEESCEPVRASWVDKFIGDMDKGASIVGWDWHFEGRKRHDQIKHKFTDDKGNIMIAYENTLTSGLDAEGNVFDKTWDIPCYRDETFVVRAKDFIDFDYPDVSDDFWEKRNGIRGYGIRAERFWWDMKDVHVHGFKFPSPSIQWFIFQKYKRFPTPYNKYFSYFWEMPYQLRKSSSYRPAPIILRQIKNCVRSFFPWLLRTGNIIKKLYITKI